MGGAKGGERWAGGWEKRGLQVRPEKWEPESEAHVRVPPHPLSQACSSEDQGTWNYVIALSLSSGGTSASDLSAGFLICKSGALRIHQHLT